MIIQIDNENLFYWGQMLMKPGTILKNHSYHSTGTTLSQQSIN